MSHEVPLVPRSIASNKLVLMEMETVSYENEAPKFRLEAVLALLLLLFFLSVMLCIGAEVVEILGEAKFWHTLMSPHPVLNRNDGTWVALLFHNLVSLLNGEPPPVNN